LLKINFRSLIEGTFILLIAVPFLFSQELNFSHSSDLSYSSRLRKTSCGQADFSLKLIDSLKKKDKPFLMKKSPIVATILSVAIPGAGQFYNQSYWKIPIIAGLVGYFGYEYIRENNLYKDYRDQYIASQQQIPPLGDQNLLTLREFYRDQRDNFVWYFLITYVVNIVDAYVDAHLFDFDVSEEKPSKGGMQYKLNLNIKIKL